MALCDDNFASGHIATTTCIIIIFKHHYGRRSLPNIVCVCGPDHAFNFQVQCSIDFKLLLSPLNDVLLIIHDLTVLNDLSITLISLLLIVIVIRFLDGHVKLLGLDRLHLDRMLILLLVVLGLLGPGKITALPVMIVLIKNDRLSALPEAMAAVRVRLTLTCRY